MTQLPYGSVRFEPVYAYASTLIPLDDDLPLAIQLDRLSANAPIVALRPKTRPLFQRTMQLASHYLLPNAIASTQSTVTLWAERAARLFWLSSVLTDPTAAKMHGLTWMAHEAQLEPTTPERTVGRLLACLQREVAPTAASSAHDRGGDGPMQHVVAIYAELDMALIVLRANATDAIAQLDFAAISAEFDGRFKHFLLTTEPLMNAIAEHIMPMSFFIGRFTHVWGKATVAVDAWPLDTLMQEPLQLLLYLQTQQLPSGYLLRGDADDTLFLHDAQNHLLKIQFQYDLLTMLSAGTWPDPPQLSGTLGLPTAQRMARVEENIEAWIKLYRQLGAQSP